MSSSVGSTASPGAAFAELEQLVRHLGEELSSFRRRALHAEARLKSFESEREQSQGSATVAADRQAAPSDPRVADLEAENAELRRRLEAATSRTRQVLDRVRFLRQQQAQGGER